MHKIVSFGGVAFPDTGRLFQTNFADLITQSSKSYGLDGGVDMYDNERSPSEVGNIRYDFWLHATSRIEMDGLREQYKELAYLGKQSLIMQPEDINAATRWCSARVSSIGIDQEARRRDDQDQLVSMTFSVPYPRWYATVTETGALWGAGTWGTSYWGSTARQSNSITASGDTITLTNNGNAIAYPVFGISDTGGSGISNPIRLSRIVSSEVVEYVELTTNVTAGGGAIIDCTSHTVYNGTENTYGNLTVTHPEWIRLLPGSNTIRVNFGAGTFTIATRWYDTYY